MYYEFQIEAFIVIKSIFLQIESFSRNHCEKK